MAEQFFFDADANNDDKNVLDCGALNAQNQEAPIGFSQFNKWTLVDESDIEEEAEKEFLEMNTSSEQGLEEPFSACQPEPQMGNQPFEETLLDVDEEKNPDRLHESFDDEHESEAIISKESMQRHAHTNLSAQTGMKLPTKKQLFFFYISFCVQFFTFVVGLCVPMYVYMYMFVFHNAQCPINCVLSQVNLQVMPKNVSQLLQHFPAFLSIKP